METRDEEILIIGAGLSGLTLARGLKAVGKSCLVLEKSRGLGGRIATRRIDDWGLDHGASFLSFSQCFEEFLKLSPEIIHQSPQGFYLYGGMNRLAKTLAADLEILKNQRAHLIEPVGPRWKVQTEEGLSFMASKLVITAPIPQAIQLLEANRLQVPAELRGIHYKKALIYLAIFKHLNDDLKSCTHQEHSICLMRERNLHPRGVVMRLSDHLAEDLFEKSDDEILRLINEVIKSGPLKDAELEKAELKKWRFSEPHHFHPDSYCELLPNLFLTGDGFNGAIRSANNLVQVLRS